jgi:hypothetical protein
MAEVERRMEWAERRPGPIADMYVVIKGMRREIDGPTIDAFYAETLGRRVHGVGA